MSSTAIVSKMLAERSELGTPHGRDVMGILLFQDLAVVAFLILIPSLRRRGGELAQRCWRSRWLKAAVALAVILFLGQRPMRAWFHLVARQRSSELFMLNVLLVTLGLAALTELAGLSLALGAFLAGMLIAETEYRYQVEEDIKPFRDVLLGLFFVTVGMMLDLGVAARSRRRAGRCCCVVPVVGEARADRRARAAFRRAARHGAAHRLLSRAGRRVRAGAARRSQLAHRHRCRRDFTQIVLAAMVLSMLLAPLLIQYAEHDGAQADRERLARARRADHAGSPRDDGAAGSRDRLRVRPQRPEPGAAARARGHRVTSRSTPTRSACAKRPATARRVVYGDASRRKEALVAAGLAKARARGHHVRGHADRAQDPASRAAAAAGAAGDRAHASTTASSTGCSTAGRGRSRARSARRQPDARVAFAAGARRAAQSRAGAHPRDPRGALQPLPRLLSRRDRFRGRRREPAAAAALGAARPSARMRSASALADLGSTAWSRSPACAGEGARSRRAGCAIGVFEPGDVVVLLGTPGEPRPSPRNDC